MASCPKCGKGGIRKRPDGCKKCKHCGFLPSSDSIMLNGRKPVNPFGSCFDSAAHILFMEPALADTDAVMCHGIGVANMPGQEGHLMAHAWIEFDHPKCARAALDPIWMIAQSADKYRKDMQMEFVITYTRDEFMKLWELHDYPGPYHPKIKAQTTEGKAKAALERNCA